MVYDDNMPKLPHTANAHHIHSPTPPSSAHGYFYFQSTAILPSPNHNNINNHKMSPLSRPPSPVTLTFTPPPPTPETNTNMEAFISLIATDLAASNALADRISQLRLDIAEGKPLPDKKVDLMERSNKDMTKDLVSRVEKIESSDAPLDANDREMLQALNARLAVCDLQAMRLAELRDVEVSARSTMQKGVVKEEAKNVEANEEEEEVEAEAKPDTSPRTKFEEQKSSERELHGEDGVERDSEYDSESDSHTEDEDSGSAYSDDLGIDKSDWPLLYRIMDVDPDTLGRDIEPLLNKYVTHLSRTNYHTRPLT